jgi:integrase/recombinase XerD
MWVDGECVKKSGGQAAWGRNRGYQPRNTSSSSLLRTLVRICNKRWAPRSVHCICCRAALNSKNHDGELAPHDLRRYAESRIMPSFSAALLDTPDPSSRTGLRDRAMFHLAYAGGLRVSELVGLRLADLALHRQSTIHVIGKGRRERVLPLWKETARALRDWLKIRDLWKLLRTGN